MPEHISDTDRILWNASRSDHPARVASWRAVNAISQKDREQYINLYAPDGVIHDPVGRTVLDPTGVGHRGHDALAEFWDRSIAPISGLSFVVHTSLATDDEVANSFTMTLETADYESTSMECIFVYRVDRAGLLVYVGGYWEIGGPDTRRCA